MPQVVAPEEWQAELDKLHAKEKQATRALDVLAAERRMLPMVHIRKDYALAGPDGPAHLVDLFDGRRQLIVYHFMFEPDDAAGCTGCSMFVDNLGHLAHVRARDTSFALVSRAPLPKLEEFRRRMGWNVPWYSSFGTGFNDDFIVGRSAFGLSVFLRDGDDVFRTYYTDQRGVEALSSNWALLDVTPFGRQETWQEAPSGVPQGPPYEWWRLHDEYDS